MSPEAEKLRVLLGKDSWDAHDRGIKLVAEILKEAGMEVIYVRYEVPNEIATAARDEDVDVIGISFSTGGHKEHITKLIKKLREYHMDDILVIVGGTIPGDEIPDLLQMGVAKIFGPGATSDEIISFITSRVVPRKRIAPKEQF